MKTNVRDQQGRSYANGRTSLKGCGGPVKLLWMIADSKREGEREGERERERVRKRGKERVPQRKMKKIGSKG